jgi:acyl-CoA dehydrogenase
MDGPNEVHKVTIARNVLMRDRPHAGNGPRQFLPARREAAQTKFAEVLAADPGLAAKVEAVGRGQDASIS